ncbi:MAG: hypothetical protein GC200_05255 [Tepidisphaera sp.]|nr:hypothetical protein [Tepidisphaera sp.]
MNHFRRLTLACTGLSLLAATPALATFHTWRVSQLYSDSTGNVQFIEFHEVFGDASEQFLAGHNIVAASTFTFPTNLPLPSNTADRYFLVATSAYQALPGSVTPDYIIPSNFLSRTGGSLNYAAGIDVFTYGALPSNGTSALFRNGISGSSFSVGANSETNFAGRTGAVSVPAPGMTLMFSVGLLAAARRRR